MESTTPISNIPTKSTSNPFIDFLGRLIRAREFTLVVLIVLIALVLQLYTGDLFIHFNPLRALNEGNFFTGLNLRAISLGFATSAIIVFGMTAALVSGGFDLSVGSVFAFGSVTAATALRANLPIPISILCGVGAGVIAG
jgi:ribose/xylose/arabinose/galactoside ABC-type transport system permease subunit